MSKFVLLAVVLVLQVCLATANDSSDSIDSVDASESQGVFERAKEAYKELKSKVVNVGSTAAEFFQMYYEDQVKPVTDPYVDWATQKAKSVWSSIKNKVSRDETE